MQCTEHRALIGDAAHRLAVRVEISDDGRGVLEDLAERIFLPLAQQVAREHRGALSYRSRPGHTAFTLPTLVPDYPLIGAP